MAGEKPKRCSCDGTTFCGYGVGKWYRVRCDYCGREAKRASRSRESAIWLWNEERSREVKGAKHSG